ncbi:molybdenum cofactor cytidylyltransferase [Pseudomonas sp. SJZ103]|jgi:molybdenum cofactor cytidylyltransferase|uniref:nucleotidyltransferase family protein n=1 Tax=unclassified Pseudomonas TaxID=196821 RepID=UPI00119E48EE|nr:MULTISPECIES: nucleotidyltransferase family protein [unclassified Pseudomonas]MBB6285733.1 molybdenum cofactor cytidylyltransferase [Pseudomonas sp. SJZ073]MBB6312343.1 molybdenum cofactor cytidylyltransferase [Pseudomonas sp. JAI120]MCS4312065.1 molybdenum cofactor cytidylyltransferase [Pseudomonas sp. BIGb0381]TWC61208.1 molybdenum cofactor cytidylyltransferase [Pseudomonas sp. SJZ103]TWC78430.1 molybdenum cofactor cytidylyltransferase [Pseudomonas sp. SJZ094]
MLTAIVLAAGQGSRFRAEAGADQDKLLADCVGRDGVMRPVIEQVLVNLPDSLVARWLVTSPDRTEVIRLAEAYGCQVLLLQSAGMGESIAAAVAASASADGWLVVLGDMPFIQSSSIERVIEVLEEDGISVPVQAGEYGHPVAFGRALGPDLMALTGDRGGKPLFARARVREVQVEDAGVLWDVDLPKRLSFSAD